MKVINGHLTQTEKRAIKAILTAGLMRGKVKRKNYSLTENRGTYTVKIQEMRTKTIGRKPEIDINEAKFKL